MIEVDGGEKYRKLSVKDKFKFSCHKGLACFGQCCSDVNIFLTPYDVLRMRKALDLASGKFLKKYTATLLAKQKLPLVLLKMNDDARKSCPFVTSEGCSVYQDRPWACRMFPVGTTTKTLNPDDGEEFCFLTEEGSPCRGTEENQEWTVAEWFQDQGIDLYNEKNEAYKAITLPSLFREGNGLTLPKAQMFYVSLYDLDRFRGLLFESSFFSRFDIEKKVMEKIKVDDEALLDFGDKWLRFSLFGEKTLRIKSEIVAKKKSQKKRS